MAEIKPQFDEGKTAVIRTCLGRVLGSPLFAKADRQRRFLQYLADETLAGQGHRLKGYSIGSAVFDRAEDFDPRIDAIVRVEAVRLRAKLREYYGDIGGADEVHIILPKGSYELNFAFGQSVRAERDANPIAARTPRPLPPKDLMPAITVPTDRPSLAVMPFANLTKEPDQDYFADGMTDDLITSLSRLSGLLVIGRQSVFVYKNCDRDTREIARTLGVRYLLEGSVRRSDRRVRINAQLVDAAGGHQLWAERYDREIEDIFALQDDVTQRIVEALEVRLSDAETRVLLRSVRVSVEAYDLLLCGLERYWEYNIKSIEAAQAFFVKALRVEPKYAAAHAWLARAYLYRFSTFLTDRPDLCELGFYHAQRAVEFDPGLAITHAILGWAQFWRGNGVEALAASRRAVQMDPNNPDLQLFLAIIHGYKGHGNEGAECVERALRLNPHPTTFYLFALGICRFMQARYEEAVIAFEKGIDLAPGFNPNIECLISAYGMLGHIDEAAPYIEVASRAQSPDLICSRWQKFFLDKGAADHVIEGFRQAGLLNYHL